jgi:hypothetical protein
MELRPWDNGNGFNLKMDDKDILILLSGIEQAIEYGKGNAVFETQEIDIELERSK